jgi:hypothetical protein
VSFPQWEFPVAQQTVWPLLVSDPANGPIHRANRWGGAAAGASRLQRWGVRLKVGAVTDKNLIKAEFDAVRGGAGSTDFTPPGEALSVKVRFLSSSLRWRRLSAGRYVAEVEVEELREGLTS